MTAEGWSQARRYRTDIQILSKPQLGRSLWMIINTREWGRRGGTRLQPTEKIRQIFLKYTELIPSAGIRHIRPSFS